MDVKSKSRRPVYHPLQVGSRVSLESVVCEPAAARVVGLTANGLHLELSHPPDEPLYASEDRIRVVYWEEGTTHCWSGKVVSVKGAAGLFALIPDEPVTIQQRKLARYRLAVPFSLTVVEAQLSRLNGICLRDCESIDISAGGIGFEVGVPLSVGDKLVFDLKLEADAGIRVVGSVVRTEQLKGRGSLLYFVGAEFFFVDEDAQKQLSQFLSLSLLKQSSLSASSPSLGKSR